MAPTRASELFTEREQQAFARALDLMNVGPSDPGFAKDHGEPRLALGWIRAALEQPALLNRVGERLWTAAQEPSGAALWPVASELLESPPGKAVPFAVDEPTWPDLPRELVAPLTDFLSGAWRADQFLQKALEGLSPEDRSYLAAANLSGPFNIEDEESTRNALLDAGIGQAEVDQMLVEIQALDATPAADRFLGTLSGLDRADLMEAGRIFHGAVKDLVAQVRGITNWPTEHLTFSTDLGSVLIAAPGDHSFATNALLLLSPGGRNTYRGEAGVANGLRGQFLSALVDLGGNDAYESVGLLGAGSALLGVSVLWDEAGDDVYRAAYTGQGAGFCGVGWLEDGAGNDDYQARALAQGASACGVGVLRDLAGDDRYQVGLQGQAFASMPGFAALIDRAGNDQYKAGGRELDHERNPEHYLSLAQGFAIGQRPFAGGGVAMLADLAGNDTYDADVYGQAVSYYYSAAFLFDGAGHDRYAVHHYGQGAGIHLSHGLLVDLAGDDHYQGGILVQGAAHDYAVGGLLDRAGRDTYMANQNAQGHGMNNSFAWLVEGGGDDVYASRDPTSTQGVGNNGGDRDYGSLALLLDLGGRDTYSAAGTNGAARLRPLYGVILDEEDAP